MRAANVALWIVLASSPGCGDAPKGDPDALPASAPLEVSCVNAASFSAAVRAPDDPDTIWGLSQVGYAHVSHDGGATWAAVFDGSEDLVTASTVVPFDAERAFVIGSATAGASAGPPVALYTRDGGATKTLAASMDPGAVVHGRTAEASFEADGLQVAFVDSIAYLSRDGGASWDLAGVTEYFGPGIGALPETNGDGSGRFLVDALARTVASWDYGLSTVEFSTPDAEFQVRAIGPPGHLLFAGMPHIEDRGGIYASRDSGANWERVWRGGGPMSAWVDPRDDAVWIPLASEQDGIGRVLEMRLLVLHDWGTRSELFAVSAGGVPLIGMKNFRRVGDAVDFIGVFQPSDNVRAHLACRVGPGVTSRLDAVHPAIPANAPAPGEVALVARRFEETWARTSMTFDGSGNPWVLHDQRLMGAAPPVAPWWLQPGVFPFDDWNEGTGFQGLLVDVRGRMLIAQGPRQYNLGGLHIYSLDPNAQRVVDKEIWDDVRVRNEAGNPVVPPPRRLLWALGMVWIGTAQGTAPLVRPGPDVSGIPNALPDFRNAAPLPGAGSFSPDGRWYAWTSWDPERAQARLPTGSPVLIGPVLSGRFDEVACNDDHSPNVHCVDYPGEAWNVAVTSDRLVLVLDRLRGIVVARHFEDPAAPWTRVAEGFIHPTDMVLREVAGRDVVFVHDGDVFAFSPDLGTVARRSLNADTKARTGPEPRPFVVPSVPTSADPFGCVDGHPCIRPERQGDTVAEIRVVPWTNTEYTLRGEGLGTAGTLFVDGEPYPTTLWTETGVYFSINDPDRPDGELWIEVDGVASNHLQHVSAPVVEAVEPAVAEPGEVVSILGRNFGATQGAGLIHPRLDAAGHGLVVGWSDTRVDFVVEGAQSGTVPVNVYKLGVYASPTAATFDVLPVIVSGCRSPRHEKCRIKGASLGDITSLTIDGVAATPEARRSDVAFTWPDGVAPGPHEAKLRTASGVERTVPVVLERWARRELGSMSPEGHNLAAHAGWLAQDGDQYHLATIAFTIGVQGGRPIPGPPYLAIASLAPSPQGMAVGGQGLPKYRQSPTYEDLPWVAVHDGVVWTAGSAQSFALSIGADGQDVLTGVTVPDPREARVAHALSNGELVDEDVVTSAPGETGRPVGLASYDGALWIALHRDDEAGTRLLVRGEQGWSLATRVETQGGFAAAADALYLGACGERSALVRVTSAGGVVASETLPASGLDLIERCAASPGGGMLAVGVDTGGARSVVRYSAAGGWVALAAVPGVMPGYSATTEIAIEDVGDVDGAPALLVAVREGPERGLRLMVFESGTWRQRGDAIANLSARGPWVCPGPWGNLNECSGDMGNLGCAFFACPTAPETWRQRAGHVGRARFGHHAGLTTVVYEQWFDDGRGPGDVLGDNMLMAATLTSP